MTQNIQSMSLAAIRIDGGTQARAELDQGAVADYRDAMLAGASFPPVVVFFDGTKHWLADGFHRFHGARAAKLAEIKADIRAGTARDAILFSVGANSAHGLRRSNDDKRKAVLTLLNDAEWSGWSDRAISRACGVSDHFVGDIRKSICERIADSTARTVERGGTIYKQNTAAIGRKEPPAAAVAPVAPIEPAPPAAASLAAPDDNDGGPDAAELASAQAAALADQEALQRLIDSDDKLAEAVREIKRLNAVVAALKSRINGLQGETAAATRLAKQWKARAEKLEKVKAVA